MTQTMTQTADQTVNWVLTDSNQSSDVKLSTVSLSDIKWPNLW